MKTLDDYIRDIGIVNLTTTPNGYKGCCCINPAHQDNKPSMYITFSKGMVKCFSCGAFVPLFDFLTDHGVPFDMAIDYLFMGFRGEDRAEAQELNEYVLGTFLPKSMIDRGFLPETLQHFDVGYDDYEGHITIPMRYNGKLYGITYRKYPKTFWSSPGFVKDDFIYNYEPTEERVYVEGLSDTWRVWQNGTKNVSAWGTNMPSEGMISLMQKHKRILLAGDHDYAGFKGMFKVNMELGREKEIFVVPYKAGDPGECPEENWQKAMEKLMTFAEFEVGFIMRNRSVYDRIMKELKNEKAK